jgi:hypothetical protein
MVFIAVIINKRETKTSFIYKGNQNFLMTQDTGIYVNENIQLI